MNSDTMVMAEWFDAYIPSRHHMSVMSYGHVLEGHKRGYVVYWAHIDVELLTDEAPPQRGSR